MRFSECAPLISRKPLALETGVERLSSGGMHVAIRMILEGCTARMLEWWFGCECDSYMYKMWHPGAHKYSAWGEYEPYHKKGNVIGSTHIIKEAVGAGGPVMNGRLKYMNPADVFGADKLAEAKARGDADVALYGWGAFGDNPALNEKGWPNEAQYIGVGRDTPYGLVLRNHYWMGDTLGAPPEILKQQITEEAALNLMLHDSNEFHILGKVIPQYYRTENWEMLGAPEPY